MRNAIVILAGICLAAAVAPADSLTVNGIPYSSVRVTGVAKGKISYDLNRRPFDKPISDISQITIDTSREFNQAEKDRKAGKNAQAVAAYTQAENAAGAPKWMRLLVSYRRLPAAAAARMTGQAVADWLAIVDDAGALRSIVSMAPTEVAAKGSSENAKAISLLEKRLSSKADPIFQAKVQELLLNLYRTEGMDDKAKMLEGASAATPSSSGTGSNTSTGTPETPGPVISVTSTGLPSVLQEAASLIKLRKYDEAAENIKAKLLRLSSRDLPAALLLRGKALQLAYENSGRKDTAKLKQAGLCFMRVVACFDPSIKQGPEALYLAATVSGQLGNKVAASNAYRLLLSRYPGSDWATKAQAALGGGAPMGPGMGE